MVGPADLVCWQTTKLTQHGMHSGFNHAETPPSSFSSRPNTSLRSDPSLAQQVPETFSLHFSTKKFLLLTFA